MKSSQMPLKILDFASDAEEAAWLDHNWAELAELTTKYGVPLPLTPRREELPHHAPGPDRGLAVPGPAVRASLPWLLPRHDHRRAGLPRDCPKGAGPRRQRARPKRPRQTS